MNLFIVESPAKINKICSLLGKQYKGISSYGHIMDLAEKTMSIDFEDNFNPIYVVIKNERTDKNKVVADLIKAAKDVKQVYIATDKDREGEMIGWNIATALNLKNPKRIVFTSITKGALQKAIKEVGTINMDMVNSQKARRVIDRLVGFELSPLVDAHMMASRLSAGRVQSVVARLIVDRETEINKFFSNDNLSSFFQFVATFMIKQQLKTQLYTKKAPLTSKPFKGEISKIGTKEEAVLLLNTMTNSKYTISHIFDKKRMQSAPIPYTTSTLQQDCSVKLSFNGKRTMLAAQHLYEAGYITYMRTDSIILSDDALNKIEKYILANYDEKYYKKTVYASKDGAQEAHEAIRPTDFDVVEIEPYDKIQNDEIRLYNLIWKRTVASQMSQAEYNDVNIQISIDKLDKYYFGACIPNLVFDGFLILYKVIDKENDDKVGDDDNVSVDNNKKFDVKNLVEGNVVDVVSINVTQKYDTPPSRYNEASLLNKLDVKHLNIGRPATLVNIIEKIIAQKYVEIKDVDGKEVNAVNMVWKKGGNVKEVAKVLTLCKDKKRFVPTKLGIDITKYLVDNFTNIMDYQFTSLMEQKLDDIAKGKLVWHEVVREFYDEFHPLVMKFVNINKIKRLDVGNLLGEYLGKKVYASNTKYGPRVKYVDGETIKFFKFKEPLTLENLTIEDASKIISENLGYPKHIGIHERKKIVLNKNGDSYYLTFNKKNYSCDNKDITLEKAIECIKNGGKVSLLELKGDGKVFNVYKGKDNHYVNILNLNTKKTYNVPLPDGVVIGELTVGVLNRIVKERFNNNGVGGGSNNNSSEDGNKVVANNNNNNNKVVKKVVRKKAINKK